MAKQGEIVGYARVSSVGQSLEAQLEELEAAGCEQIYEEKRSGRETDNRPALKEALRYVRAGDVFVVTRLDRLARSVRDLQNIAHKLNEKGVGFRVLKQQLDTTTSEGRFMFSILSAVAEFENELRRERQQDGIERAKENGVKFGPREKLTPEQVEALREAVASQPERRKADIAKDFGISRASLYRVLKG